MKSQFPHNTAEGTQLLIEALILYDRAVRGGEDLEKIREIENSYSQKSHSMHKNLDIDIFPFDTVMGKIRDEMDLEM